MFTPTRIVLVSSVILLTACASCTGAAETQTGSDTPPVSFAGCRKGRL